MVALMSGYLFDRPEYWYNPRENTTPRSWTQSSVPGNRLADKPVYVLTSTRTFSGAEQFSYDLKMLKRAILVGETTGGAAHSGVFVRIDDHFGIGIPETKSINPISKTDWAETGGGAGCEGKGCGCAGDGGETGGEQQYRHSLDDVQGRRFTVSGSRQPLHRVRLLEKGIALSRDPLEANVQCFRANARAGA